MPEVEQDGPFVLVTRVDDVAYVVVERPRVNALSIEVLDELSDAFDALGDDLPGAVVVSGGPHIFSAGADVHELADASKRADVIDAFGRALELLVGFPRATIASIAGGAFGGGLELALACDLRVAADDARLGFPEVLLGIIPGAGGTQRATRLIGPSRTKDLLFTGRTIEASEALGFGLVDRVVARDGLDDAVRMLAGGLASGAVVAHSLAKQAVDEGIDYELEDALALERSLFFEVCETDDAAAGIESFLLNGPGHARFSGS